jgi:glycosyltransferase involved in cell wall biosynthesis
MGWERKPKIVLMSDVGSWAWYKKSLEIKKHLADEFDIDIYNVLENRTQGGINVNNYDLYFTYGWSYIGSIRAVPIERRISGVTAHKDGVFFNNTIVPQMKQVMWYHANSILLKNELEKAVGKVFYVPNGVDETMFYERKPIPLERDNLVVLHVGKKCGHGTDAKGHTRFIEPACAKAGVKYIGHYNNYKTALPTEKMAELYQKADVCIIASQTDGTPNMGLEGAASGRPIISNRIGNMPEFIKDDYNGFLVERDVDKYVEKLLYLKNNRDKLIEMGKNARKTVEEGWTWKIQAENYRKMFQTILLEVGLR